MMSDLPTDLIEEILSRVPATSLKRLRSTCKRWNTLFKNRGFTEMHFRKAAKQSLALMLKDCRVCSLSVDLNVVAPSVEFKSTLSLKESHTNSKQVDIATVFHCDGLLLCTSKDNRLVVWNPCLEETRWIQLKDDKKGLFMFSLGYNLNNKSCRSYNILKYWANPYFRRNNRVVAYEIYEFSSYSWRVLDNVSVDHYIDSSSGLSLKGNTYWLAIASTSDGDTNFLLSFDFTTERFKRLCFPPIQKFGCMALSVVREEELSVVLYPNLRSSKIVIWMTKRFESEAVLLWRKSFTVDLKRNSFIYLPVCMSFLIDEEKKVAVCCGANSYERIVYIIREDDNIYYKEIPFVESTNRRLHPCILNYVPSLVLIQREVEAKEKNETS